jgi:DnaK suppressor protein
MPDATDDPVKLNSRHPDLSKKSLERLYGKLLEVRREVLGQLEQDLHEGRELQDTEPEDFPGHATFEATRDQLFALSQAEQDQLREVEDALRRFQEGIYGLCDFDEAPIPVERLEAVPWARYCLEHEERAEAGKLDEEE